MRVDNANLDCLLRINHRSRCGAGHREADADPESRLPRHHDHGRRHGARQHPPTTRSHPNITAGANSLAVSVRKRPPRWATPARHQTATAKSNAWWRRHGAATRRFKAIRPTGRCWSATALRPRHARRPRPAARRCAANRPGNGRTRFRLPGRCRRPGP